MISKRLKFKIFILIMFIIFTAGTVFVLAAEVNYSPAFPWEGTKEVSGLVQKFYTMALATVGVAALGALIYGAILWTVSEAVSSKQDAMEWIKGALLGLVLLLGAVLLLQTINPELVKLKEPDITPVKKVEKEGSKYGVGTTENTIRVYFDATAEAYNTQAKCEKIGQDMYKERLVGVIFDSKNCIIIVKKL